MKEIIKIFENSMSLTITTIIAAIGVGLNVWFKKKVILTEGKTYKRN